MNIKNLKALIKKTQPKAFKLLKTIHRNKKISHLYLINASKGIDTNLFAMFLISVIISKNENTFGSPYDENVQRLPNDLPDIHYIDGESSQILKPDVIEKIMELKKTSIEHNAKKILYIKGIENGNSHALNSLLKFIEEPTKKTYIILTTNSMLHVLPTIKSRCNIINLNPITEEKIIEIKQNFIAQNKVVNKMLYSRVFQTKDISREELTNFNLKTKEIILKLKIFIKNKTSPNTIFSDLFPKKTDWRLVINLLNQFFYDILRLKINKPLSYQLEEKLVLEYVNANYDFEKALKGIDDFIKHQKYHCNFSLSVNQLCNSLKGW